MPSGICHLAVVPCRAEPSDRSEMVTQLLFGETFEILETFEKWSKIRIHFDDYECFISNIQYKELEEKQLANIRKQNSLSNDLLQVITKKDSNLAFPVCIGSSLPLLEDNICRIADTEYVFEGSNLPEKQKGKSKKQTRDNICETAYLFLNSPYLWGGRTPMGIDCSGFTQIVYKLNGLALKRDAWQQAQQGTTLSFIEEAEPGDLAFFDNEEGRIVHVGIFLSDQRIIHAAGCVRIDKLDHFGIFNGDYQRYSHRLRIIKSLI